MSVVKRGRMGRLLMSQSSASSFSPCLLSSSPYCRSRSTRIWFERSNGYHTSRRDSPERRRLDTPDTQNRKPSRESTHSILSLRIRGRPSLDMTRWGRESVTDRRQRKRSSFPKAQIATSRLPPRTSGCPRGPDKTSVHQRGTASGRGIHLCIAERTFELR